MDADIEKGFLLLRGGGSTNGLGGVFSRREEERGEGRRSAAFDKTSTLPRLRSTDPHSSSSFPRPASASPTPSLSKLSRASGNVTAEELRFIASPGSGDHLTIKDTNLRRSLLEKFIASEVRAISTRVDEAVFTFNSGHAMAIISEESSSTTVPHVSIVEVRSALEEVFRMIDDKTGDRNRILNELQLGVGSIVRRAVLEDRTRQLKLLNRSKISSKLSSRRGSVSGIDDKIESRLQHVDDIIDRCYQTFSEREQRKGPSKEDFVALDAFIKEANENIARDQLLGESAFDNDEDDDLGAPASVLKSAMSCTALHDMIAKAKNKTESIRTQLASIFSSVTDLLRGKESAHEKSLTELRLKLNATDAELILLQKSLSESIDAIRATQASLDFISNQLRLKDLALENCTKQLLEAQRLIKKLETENEIRKSVTDKHQPIVQPPSLQHHESNANSEPKRTLEAASKAASEAKASADRSASEKHQAQMSELQKRLLEAEARERALQIKLQSTMEALQQSKQDAAAAAAAASLSVSAKTIPQNSSFADSTVTTDKFANNVNAGLDKEINDLRSQVAMLTDKIRELDRKLRESEKSSVLSTGTYIEKSNVSVLMTLTPVIAETSSSTEAVQVAAQVALPVAVPSLTPLPSQSKTKSETTSGSKAIHDQEVLSAKRDAEALKLNSEIERLRQQLLTAKRESDDMKSTVSDMKKKNKNTATSYTQTDTDADKRLIVDDSFHDSESPLERTSPITKKANALPSPIQGDKQVPLSLIPIHRVNEGVDRGVNASYCVVGAGEVVHDGPRSDRSTDRHALPKGGSPSPGDARPFSPISASAALKEASRTHVDEANRFKGASQSVPLQRSLDVISSEALSPENLHGLQEAIEILGRHLYFIRRFGGRSGSSDWMNEETGTRIPTPVLTFTDLIDRIEDLHVRVSHPLQTLHSVLKRASDAHHGTSSLWIRSNSRTVVQSTPVTVSVERTPTKPFAVPTHSATAVPFALLQQALVTPSKVKLPRV